MVYHVWFTKNIFKGLPKIIEPIIDLNDIKEEVLCFELLGRLKLRWTMIQDYHVIKKS